MHIAQVATVATPVRRFNSGSVESLVWLLTRELVTLGHQVTVFGTAGSDTAGECVETLPGPYGVAGAPDDWLLCEWLNVCAAAERAAEFDIIHTHGYLLGVPLQNLVPTPMLHTLHVMPGSDQHGLARRAGRAALSALSAYQWSEFPDAAPHSIVAHGVDPDDFSAGSGGEYVLYLGRFLPSKGPLESIAAAREAGLPIVLAGPENDYFRQRIAPLVDGVQVRYAGSVTGAQRVALFQAALALAYAPSEGEPFGLVLIEAMMCGTPVGALRVGAVAEIVEDGLTGALADDVAGLPEALRRAAALDRASVRTRAEQRFTGRRMALDYLRAYGDRLGLPR